MGADQPKPEHKCRYSIDTLACIDCGADADKALASYALRDDHDCEACRAFDELFSIAADQP